MLYYPYKNRIAQFNVLNFDQQYPLDPDKSWEMALYPRIVEQKMYNVDTQNLNVNSLVKIYEATYNIDVVVYPTIFGSWNNLVENYRFLICNEKRPLMRPFL